MNIQSNLRPQSYCEKDVVRVINPRQQKMYIKHGCYPIDLYSSYDTEGNDIVVFIFLKEETRELYTAWCNHELD